MPRYTLGIAAMVLVLAGQCVAVPPVDAAARLQIRDGLLVVEGVYLNGQGPYVFLLDTGSAVNHLDPVVVQALGLAPTFKSEIISSTGRTAVFGTDRMSVELDGARADNQMFFFIGMGTVRLPRVKCRESSVRNFSPGSTTSWI